MGVAIVATEPSDREPLIEFLAGVFSTTTRAPFLEPAFFQWKYFRARPDWNSPRSYIMKDGSRIVGHVGVYPVPLMTRRGLVKGAHMIDWAASRQTVGGGLLLMRKVMELADVVVSIGGSPATRQLLPMLGFSTGAQLDVFARVERPWKQARLYRPREWTLPLRLVRNAVWSLAPMMPARRDWTSTRGGAIDLLARQVADSWLADQAACSLRSTAGLDYLGECPGGRVSSHVIGHAGKNRGYFVVCRPGPQARIAELRLDSADPDEWANAYRLATGAAASDPQACEIVAATTHALGRAALVANGFRLRQHKPVFFWDPARTLGDVGEVDISFLDTDGVFLSNPRRPFLT